MKTAVLCLALFSITFALPIAQSPHANTLRKPEIEQKGSHSAVVSHDAKAREDSLSSDENTDKAQKDAAIVPESHSIDTQGVAPPELKGSRSADVSQDDEPREDAAIVPESHSIDTQGVAPPELKGSRAADVSQDDEPREDAAIVPESHSIDTQGVAPPELNSHFSDATEDSYDQEDPLLPVANDDGHGQEIHFSDEDAEEFGPEDGMFFDAANDPEPRDVEFADDTLANEPANVDEDPDVLTAQ